MVMEKLRLVSFIYRKLTEGVFTTRTRSALTNLWDESLESLGALNQNILFAFDEVLMASGQLKNIVNHVGLQGEESQGNVQTPTDLLHGFVIFSKRFLRLAKHLLWQLKAC